jgi:hypothetical protein
MFLVPGDSGAWVFEKSTGRVCGHVLAWSEKSHTAYIAPMEVLLEDIARTLNASYVALPDSPHGSLAYGAPHNPYFEPQNPRYRSPLPLPDQIPVDMGHLRLEDATSPPPPPPRPPGPAHPSRGLREVPSSTPYGGLPPILTPPRSLERQLA